MSFDVASMSAGVLAPASVNIIHDTEEVVTTFAWQGRVIFSRYFGSVRLAMDAIDDMAADLCVEVLHIDIVGIR